MCVKYNILRHFADFLCIISACLQDCCYLAFLIGRITTLARPSVPPLVRLFRTKS